MEGKYGKSGEKEGMGREGGEERKEDIQVTTNEGV